MPEVPAKRGVQCAHIYESFFHCVRKTEQTSLVILDADSSTQSGH